MTWTWGNAPGLTTAATRRDAIRSLIGDTVTTNQLQTDEQLAFYLTFTDGSTFLGIRLAAAMAAEAIAGLYSQKADSLTIGRTKVDYQEAAARFLALAASLKKAAAAAGGGGIYMGGISVADNLAHAENSDVVQPQSYTGRDSYPGTNPPLGTSEQEGP